MSNSEFSPAEMAFFEEGDTLSESAASSEEDLDRDTAEVRTSGWVERAMAVLALVNPARSS